MIKLNIKLKDLLICISTQQKICIRDKSTKVTFYPTYGELEGYHECRVRGIEVNGDKLEIEIVSAI